MVTKKEPQRRRSLNERLDAELAAAESIQVAGINSDQPTPTSVVINQQEGRGETPAQPLIVSAPLSTGATTLSASDNSDGVSFPTKKATTIMPKEVFGALQMYCIRTDTPKHRAIYHFIIDGLHAAGQITDDELHRFRELSSLLTTTYEKR